MTDLTIWFGLWDDVIEKMADDHAAAENFRVTTKDFIRRALGLSKGDADAAIPDNNNKINPLIQSFQPIAAEACASYNNGK